MHAARTVLARWSVPSSEHGFMFRSADPSNRSGGPLVGLTEEEIADEIQALQQVTNQARPLYIWTDSALIHHPVLKDTIERLQNLARKARRTTPYQLLAEAVEEIQVRPILKARHPRGAERALANIELVLEMARAYAARGVVEFARALCGPPERMWTDAACPRPPPRRDPAHDPAQDRLDHHAR